MAPTTLTATITIQRWRRIVVLAYACLLHSLEMLGMSEERANKHFCAAALWAVRGAKVR